MPEQSIPDLRGPFYTTVLHQLHQRLNPRNYLEIGVSTGRTLAIAKCPSIGIDPDFKIDSEIREILHQRITMFFRMESDAFFQEFNPSELLRGTIDLSFLDGLHHCEALLSDFINIERFCKPNSVVLMHDCLPVETGMASRHQNSTPPIESHRVGWWTGDVWKTALLLKRYRRDLSIFSLDAAPSGLILITNLNASNADFASNFEKLSSEMHNWDLAQMGITNVFDELEVQSTAQFLKSDTFSRLAEIKV